MSFTRFHPKIISLCSHIDIHPDSKIEFIMLRGYVVDVINA